MRRRAIGVNSDIGTTIMDPRLRGDDGAVC